MRSALRRIAAPKSLLPDWTPALVRGIMASSVVVRMARRSAAGGGLELVMVALTLAVDPWTLDWFESDLNTKCDVLELLYILLYFLSCEMPRRETKVVTMAPECAAK